MTKVLPLLIVALMFLGFIYAAGMSPSRSAAVSLPSGSALLGPTPLSEGPVLATAIRAGLIHPSGNSPDASTNPSLKCSPTPCALPNVQASEGGSPVNEDPIAADPSNNKNLLTGGNDYNCGNIQGFYASTDGGKTWNHNCMGNLPGCSGDGDPGVGYQTTGTAYITGIDSCSSGWVIIFETSTDHGSTWSSPATAVTPLPGFTLTDKDWLQIDTSSTSPHKNTLYICNTMFDSSSNSEIAVTHSSDNGKTWSVVGVDTKQIYPTDVDQFCDLAIGPTGIVYVTWLRCPASGPAGDCGGTNSSLLLSKSTDGGKTWSKPVTIASVTLAPDACRCAFYGSLPNTNERVSDIPAAGVSGNDVSVVFYTWTGSYMKVKVATSTNGGSSFGKGVAVAPKSDNHDQFFPWLSVSKTGVVGVTWLDRRNDPSNVNYETFGTYSTNHGTSFQKDIQVASQASNPRNDGFGGGFMGDYAGNVWVGNHLYASWMDTRSGTDCQDEVGGLLV